MSLKLNTKSGKKIIAIKNIVEMTNENTKPAKKPVKKPAKPKSEKPVKPKLKKLMYHCDICNKDIVDAVENHNVSKTHMKKMEKTQNKENKPKKPRKKKETTKKKETSVVVQAPSRIENSRIEESKDELLPNPHPRNRKKTISKNEESKEEQEKKPSKSMTKKPPESSKKSSRKGSSAEELLKKSSSEENTELPKKYHLNLNEFIKFAFSKKLSKEAIESLIQTMAFRKSQIESGHNFKFHGDNLYLRDVYNYLKDNLSKDEFKDSYNVLNEYYNSKS